ncbi:MAG: PEP-CTERM sorting domain-containing protein [Armatimonadetes bacterium]|nr:PEP-CTERM sorting domain-containing protein [Armatimonadota bacterium]
MKTVAVLSIVLLAVATPVLALDMLMIGAPGVPLEFEGWTDHIVPQYVEYLEDPYERAILAYVKNSGTEPWGSFHFKVFSGGQDISIVLFKDASMGGVNPTSSQSGLTWTINPTTPDEGQINLYFYGNPVMPGESAWFQVYEYYNISVSKLQYCIAIRPGPLPEPSSLVAITSLLGIAGLVCRRRQ